MARYESKANTKVSTGKYGEPLLIGRGERLPEQEYITPQVPEDVFDKWDYQKTAYNTMALATYHRDMKEAGDDQFLQQIAQQTYMMNKAKIITWDEELENKFKLIQFENTIDSKERDFLRNKILTEAKDPIHIPTRQEVVSEETFTPAYKERAFGEWISNLNTGQFLSREEALYGNPAANINGLVALFGRNIPDFVLEELNKRFPERTEEFEKSSALPTEEQKMKFNKLGGFKTKEGREYARNFIHSKENKSIKGVQPTELAGQVIKPTTQEEYDAIPSGSLCQDTDGVIFRKK